MMKTNKLLFFLTLLNCSLSKAQSPNISYSTPNSFEINQTITPLVSTNIGGSIPTTPIVSTFAGTGVIGSTDGSSSTSQFNYPTVVVIDNAENLIVVDRSNHKIRMITPIGNVTTIAGTGVAGSLDDAALTATFRFPDGAIVDSNGNIIITDQSNHKIRKLDTTSNNVTTIAGSGTAGYLDGTGLITRFFYPAAMAIDNADNFYIADYSNHCIRKITPLGVVSTYAGTGGSSGNSDGNSSIARFNGPTGLCFDNVGNLYVADYNNNKIRKIDTSGNVTTFCGTGVAGNVDGNATTAQFNKPGVICFDGIDTFYVTDSGNHNVRKVDLLGNVTTYAGTSVAGSTDGNALSSSFRDLTGIVSKNKDELFIADYGNHKIRKITKHHYSISPSLPTGLTFNETTGEISGTPSQLSAMTDYTVTATNEFGTSSTIVSIEVATLSVGSFQQKVLKIYPNPFENEFTFEFKNEIPKEVIFYNALGQKVMNLKPSELTSTIDFKNHNSGIYFVKMNFSSKTETFQLIKK